MIESNKKLIKLKNNILKEEEDIFKVLKNNNNSFYKKNINKGIILKNHKK